jgi:hypothetical protein
MLKIWKQTWKKAHSARRLHSEQDSDSQGAASSGASSGGSSKNSAVMPSTSEDDVSLGPALPHGRRGTIKRARASDVADLALSMDSDADRPRKKTRFEDTETPLAKDTLGNHLPEVVEAHADVRSETPPLGSANLDEEHFELAKVQNGGSINGFCGFSLSFVYDSHRRVHFCAFHNEGSGRLSYMGG